MQDLLAEGSLSRSAVLQGLDSAGMTGESIDLGQFIEVLDVLQGIISGKASPHAEKLRLFDDDCAVMDADADVDADSRVHSVESPALGLEEDE